MKTRRKLDEKFVNVYAKTYLYELVSQLLDSRLAEMWWNCFPELSRKYKATKYLKELYMFWDSAILQKEKCFEKLKVMNICSEP